MMSLSNRRFEVVGWGFRIGGACLGVLAIALLAAGSGCSLYGNAFVDETVGADAVITSSSRRAMAMPGHPSNLDRGHTPAMASPADGSVRHAALYFEDPFETRGSEDGKFAITLEDYFAVAWCDGRWLVNTMGLSGSFLVMPPCCPVRSTSVGDPQPRTFWACWKAACDAKRACKTKPACETKPADPSESAGSTETADPAEAADPEPRNSAGANDHAEPQTEPPSR